MNTIEPDTEGVRIERHSDETFPESEAVFSDCGRFRFSLSRVWDPARARVVWIMMNPSTADAFRLDPTVRRCVGFSKRWGFGGIDVFNVSPFRATYPADLVKAHDEGVDVFREAERDDWLVGALPRAGRVIVAFGSHPLVREQGEKVAALVGRNGHEVSCLGLTRDGSPRHPLYVRGDTEPRPWFTL